MTLDEYTEDELLKELEERESARKNGICDYCHRSPTTISCRFPKRHNDCRILITFSEKEKKNRDKDKR